MANFAEIWLWLKEQLLVSLKDVTLLIIKNKSFANSAIIKNWCVCEKFYLYLFIIMSGDMSFRLTVNCSLSVRFEYLQKLRYSLDKKFHCVKRSHILQIFHEHWQSIGQKIYLRLQCKINLGKHEKISSLGHQFLNRHSIWQYKQQTTSLQPTNHVYPP